MSLPMQQIDVRDTIETGSQWTPAQRALLMSIRRFLMLAMKLLDEALNL